MPALICFWICLVLVIYVYAGYPAAAFLLSRFVVRNVHKAAIEPKVSILISAFNEEQEIGRTIENKLSQSYPPERLEVIVISDGSTDRTDEIVRCFAERNPGRVMLVRQDPRQGKTRALNTAAAHATGDILVFADANSLYASNAVQSLVRGFADPSVGYITGQMIYTNETGSVIGSGSRAYMRYENRLRSWETRLGSIVGVDGGIDAVRRELYRPMRDDQLPDFVLPLRVVESGKRVVYDPDGLLYEPALSTALDEFHMRVRVSLRALWGLWDSRHLLNPFSFPLYAWQLISHKLLRYWAFTILAGLFVTNGLLIGRDPLYRWCFVLQLAVYALAALGPLLRLLPRTSSKLLVPYYVMVLNAACAVAVWGFLTGRKVVIWKPRQGT